VAALTRAVEPTSRTDRAQPRTRFSASSRATDPNSAIDGGANAVTPPLPGWWNGASVASPIPLEPATRED
jgi:hypothetical protein